MKTAFIFMHGPSISCLGPYALRIPYNAVLCGINDNALQIMPERNLNYIHFSGDEDSRFPHFSYANMLPIIKEYIAKTGCTIVTSRSKFDKFFYGVKGVVVSGYASGDFLGYRQNSLTVFIAYLSSIGFKRFVLFGCDGGGYDCDGLYAEDTKNINDNFWKFMRHVGLEDISVINVNNGGNVKCFSTVSYEEFFRA